MKRLTTKAHAWSWAVALLGCTVAVMLGLGTLLSAPVASAGPPPMDPRRMSGIPRPDAQIPGATVTVRVLRGSFDKPALEHPVELQLTNASGTKTETVSVKTLNQGRATFSELTSWVGGRAIAKVELDGETLRSAPIDIKGDIGTAVMLVSGGQPERRSPSAGGTPLPGIAFEFDKVDPGQLMVGAFDLEAKRAVEGIEITLRLRSAEGEEQTRVKSTDREGKVVFDGLDALAPGTKLVAEGKLGPDDPMRRSETFEPMPGKGMAVVLAKGKLPAAAAAPAPADPHTQAQQRRRVPGPQVVPSLAQGTVRVRIIDGADRPVAEQDVVVVMRDASQTETTFAATTDSTGVAMVDDVAVRSDAFYFVRATYDQGPYRSGFFQMDKQGGIAVSLRVFETTSSHEAVQSALQFEVRGSENDMAQVYRIYEVVVRGDKAFWVPGGMQIHAPADAKSVTVLRPAEPWLDHEGKAPFATLSRPIPPGEPVHLSLAWVAEHSGAVAIDWTPPFELLQAGVIVNTAYSLVAEGARKSDRDAPDPQVQLWELDTQRVPIQFVMEGLPIRDPTFRYVGIAFGSFLGLIALFAVLLTPRRNAKARLLTRRDELLTLLKREKGPGIRRDRIVGALDRSYRQLDALSALEEASAAPKEVPKSVVFVAGFLALGAVALVILEITLMGSSSVAQQVVARPTALIVLNWVGAALLAGASFTLLRLDARVLVIMVVYGLVVLVGAGGFAASVGPDVAALDTVSKIAPGVGLYFVVLRYVFDLHSKGLLR